MDPAVVVPLVVALISAIVVLLGYILKNKLGMNRDANTIRIKEINELNIKIHDRLVEAKEDMRKHKYISKTTEKSLLLIAARVEKYDDSLIDDIYLFLNNWTVAMTAWKSLHNNSDLSKERDKCFKLSKIIGNKIDKLHQSL